MGKIACLISDVFELTHLTTELSIADSGSLLSGNNDGLGQV